MSNLDTRTNKVACVINATFDLEQLRQLTMFGCDYYCILHDKDTDTNGIVKTKHYHLVIYRNVRTRCKWFLTRLCDLLKVNENQVSVMPIDNLEGSIQYLIHKNDADKYQYAPFDIISNINQERINEILLKDLTTQELTFERLRDICISCCFNKLKIMETIGIGRYNAFRSTINEYIQEFKVEYSFNCEYQEHTERLYSKK